MFKQLIICPICEKKQRKKIVLAERLQNGLLAIRRMDIGGTKHYTIIGGKNIQLICGNCATVVYNRAV